MTTFLPLSAVYSQTRFSTIMQRAGTRREELVAMEFERVVAEIVAMLPKGIGSVRWEPASGSFLSEVDVENEKSWSVIGAVCVEDDFDRGNPFVWMISIGKPDDSMSRYIRIVDVPYVVEEGYQVRRVARGQGRPVMAELSADCPALEVFSESLVKTIAFWRVMHEIGAE